jgi:hypothetical protein
MPANKIIASADPKRVNFTAVWPSPLIKNSCPGRTPSAVSSSGAPKKTEGIKSINVWVIAIEIMNVIEMKGGNTTIIGEESKRIDMRLICIPGRMPVIIPAKTPKRRGIINSITTIDLIIDSLNFIRSGFYFLRNV